MKKKLPILCLLLCLCISCEKDEDGNVLHYFKINGHGYVFYRFPDGTLIPCANQEVVIENFISSTHYFWLIYDAHYDYVTTDNNGFFTCRFLKKRGRTEIKTHFVKFGKIDRDNNNFLNEPTLPEHSYLYSTTGNSEISNETLENSKKDIIIDTLFIDVRVSLSCFFDDFESGNFDLWFTYKHNNYWVVNNCSSSDMPAYSGFYTAKNTQGGGSESILSTPRLFIKENTKLEFFYRSEYGGIHDSKIQIYIYGIGEPVKLLWTSDKQNLTANSWNKISITLDDYVGRNDIGIQFRRYGPGCYDVIEIDDVKIFQ